MMEIAGSSEIMVVLTNHEKILNVTVPLRAVRLLDVFLLKMHRAEFRIVIN
jgi:hypothetical protein